ncbi:Uncharacterized protein T4A_874 [Trichinella pseudospiralis]|uniref:Reverse transcriptase domain-containing protein n=1 Tax=Trichinella pseudospiralis TaxID=6337 RepID=A0A0V1ELG5_TRIPS|nr:Uncharacterized protein T4A_874 [Trichinella pseudospiralis]
MYTRKPVTLKLDLNVTPSCMKARKIPCALKEKSNTELDKLTEQGVLETVNHPVWSSPISTLVKPDKTVRICEDDKCTVSNALKKPAYLITAISHLLASLSKRKIFAKLYLAQAYQHNSELMTLRPTLKQSSIIVALCKSNAYNLRSALLLKFFKISLIKTVAGIQGELPYFDGNLIAANDEEELARRLETATTLFSQARL